MADQVLFDSFIQLDEKKLYVRILDWNGDKSIDIREFSETEKYTGWTKSGIRIKDKETAKALLEKLQKVIEEFEK